MRITPLILVVVPLIKTTVVNYLHEYDLKDSDEVQHINITMVRRLNLTKVFILETLSMIHQVTLNANRVYIALENLIYDKQNYDR